MDGFVGWLHPLRFLHGCNPSYGGLTFTPVGLTPTEHASLSLDALWSKYPADLSEAVETAA
jgi:hypothetical protein